jgi:hypothetical protein
VGGDAEPGQQGLTAVVPGADRDALPVKDLGDVVRMDALDVERDDPRAPLRRWPEDVHSRQLGQALERVGGEGVLVLLDCLHADLGQVVDRGAHPDRLADRGRAGLELVRKLVPGRLPD